MTDQVTDRAHPRPVLVVDREAVTKVALVEAMAERGNGLAAGSRPQLSDVDWAGDGKTARAMLRSKAYSLVLVDHQAPGIISADLARQIRHTSPGTRLILMDESGPADLREQAARFGFDGYLCKPFTVRAICSTINAADQFVGRSTAADVDPVTAEGVEETGSWANEAFGPVGRRQGHPSAAGRPGPLEGGPQRATDTPAQEGGSGSPSGDPLIRAVAVSRPRRGERQRAGTVSPSGVETPFVQAQPAVPPAAPLSGPLSPSVRQSLETLCADARARCVLLITTSGYPVDGEGQTQGLHLPTLGALIAANFAAAAELSRQLGNAADFRASHHQGPDSHIYTYKVSQDLLLAVIFGAESRAGAVWLFAKRAAAALAAQPTCQPPTHEEAHRPAAADAEGDLNTQMEAQWTALLNTEAEPGSPPRSRRRGEDTDGGARRPGPATRRQNSR
jgi:CheY-like chemotaxis protein